MKPKVRKWFVVHHFLLNPQLGQKGLLLNMPAKKISKKEKEESNCLLSWSESEERSKEELLQGQTKSSGSLCKRAN